MISSKNRITKLNVLDSLMIPAGKKAYVPPYTPKATTAADSRDDKVKVSSSGLSRSLVIEPVKKNGQQTRNHSTPVKATSHRSSSQNSQSKETSSGNKTNLINSARTVQKKTKSKNLSDDEEATSKCKYKNTNYTEK